MRQAPEERKVVPNTLPLELETLVFAEGHSAPKSVTILRSVPMGSELCKLQLLRGSVQWEIDSQYSYRTPKPLVDFCLYYDKRERGEHTRSTDYS